MSDVTTTPVATAVGGRLSFGRVIRAEWLKLITLRSNWAMLLLIVVFVAGLGPLISLANAHQAFNNADTDDLVTISQIGITLAQLVAGVLGVLLATNEYATGMIRATFTSVPTRLSVLVAKLLVMVGVVAVLTIVCCFIAFFGSVPIDSHSAFIEQAPSISMSGVPQAIVLGAVYLTMIAALGNGLGWLLRNTAGAIASLFGLLLVIPLILDVVPSHILNDIEHWVPAEAGRSMMAVHPSFDTYHSALVGFLLMLAYVAVALVIAAVALVARDA